MIRVLDSAGSTLVEWGRQQQQAHLTSFLIEFQTEEIKENKRSQSVALLCEGQLRRGMVCEEEPELWECDGFF